MAIAFVQQASNTAAAATVTVTLGSNTTAGNCLVVCTAIGNGSVLESVSSVKLGGVADNFAQLAAVGTLVTGAEQLAVWADPNCAGGQTAVAVTWSGGGAVLVYVFEFSGVVSASPLDQSVTFDSGGGTNSTFSVTTGTLAQATEVAIGCVYGFNTTITGPSAPWVNEATITSGTRTLQASYDIVAATTAVTYSGSFGAAAFNGQICVTLKGTTAAGINGTVQPLPAQPAPRRKPARGIWGGVKGQAYVAVPAPAQQFRTAPRRQPARAVWHGITGQAYVAVPAPRQEPPIPRRKPARAVWAGSAPFRGFVQVAAPKQPPYLPPRRPLARAYIRGSAPFLGYVAVPAPKQEPPVVAPRRVPARAWWRGNPVILAQYVAVPAPRQLPVFPRRKPARAVIQFTPVRTTNPAFIAPKGKLPLAPDDKPQLKKLLMLAGW